MMDRAIGRSRPLPWGIISLAFCGGLSSGAMLMAAGVWIYPSTPFYSEAERRLAKVEQIAEALGEPGGTRLLSAVEQFAEAAALVDENHVDKLLDAEVAATTIDGALSTLDPYSGFVTEKTARSVVDELDADPSVGFLAAGHAGAYLVEAVAPGGPADEAGLRPGDRIIGVDGRRVEGASPYAIGRIIRESLGAGGQAELRVLVARRDEADATLVVRPRTIDPVAAYDLGIRHGVLHVLVRDMFPGVAGQVEELIRQARLRGQLNGVILDLRNDGGGLTEEAKALAELFLEKDALIYEMTGRAIGVAEVRTEKAPAFPDLKVAVLVNGRSASSAEIVAGALQAHRRAVVIGWPTVGKGSVQRVFPVATGAIKVTIAEYRDGGLRKIDGVGVQPDIVLDPPDPRLRPTRFARDSARDRAVEEVLR